MLMIMIYSRKSSTHLKISTYLSSKQFGGYPVASRKTFTQLKINPMPSDVAPPGSGRKSKKRSTEVSEQPTS